MMTTEKYICRNALLKAIDTADCVEVSASREDKFIFLDDIKQIIKSLPVTDKPIIKQGHWRSWKEEFPNRKLPMKNNLGVFCSACDNHADNKTSFCPNCGAYMLNKG